MYHTNLSLSLGLSLSLPLRPSCEAVTLFRLNLEIWIFTFGFVFDREMENGDDTNIGEDEKIVLRTIKRIKSNRNKACYQNILAFVRRENKEITIENIKVTINNLLKRNIIVDINKGKSDIESFKFVTDENVENSETETTNRNSLEDFINEKFYETLVNKIKDEVKKRNCRNKFKQERH